MNEQITATDWERPSHPALDDDQWQTLLEHFRAFPWHAIPEDAVGLDLGCGDGRFASAVAHRCGRLHCVDSRQTELAKAREYFGEHQKVACHHRALEALPFADRTFDFAYSIAGLASHATPQAAVDACWRKLKPGAPFLVYALYALDNRPLWFRGLWAGAELVRRVIAANPEPLRRGLTDALAFGVYVPLTATARLAEKLGGSAESLPLSSHRDASIQTLRHQASTRFASKAEPRFAAAEVSGWLQKAGFVDVEVVDSEPFWTVLGKKKG